MIGGKNGVRRGTLFLRGTTQENAGVVLTRCGMIMLASCRHTSPRRVGCASALLTLLVKSRLWHFQEPRGAWLLTTATGFLTFHYRMQGGHPARFCVNQQSHCCPYCTVSTGAAVARTQETPYAERTERPPLPSPLVPRR